MNKNIDHDDYYTKLPEQGWSQEKVLEEAAKYGKYGEYMTFVH